MLMAFLCMEWETVFLKVVNLNQDPLRKKKVQKNNIKNNVKNICAYLQSLIVKKK